ncbi:hypothetical protein BHM03_00061935 [Ensete ventricosum]|nr:hypothetical protein BHM03_00061935 [Ensete ventricosum]
MNIVLTANPITVITKLSPGEIMILPPTIPHFTSPSPSPSPSPSKYTATTFHETLPDQRWALSRFRVIISSVREILGELSRAMWRFTHPTCIGRFRR